MTSLVIYLRGYKMKVRPLISSEGLSLDKKVEMLHKQKVIGVNEYLDLKKRIELGLYNSVQKYIDFSLGSPNY